MPLESSVCEHRLMTAFSVTQCQTRLASLSHGTADQRGVKSYQDDGADGAGGQDVILQGSAVTLRFHVGGTLVMELEEVASVINSKRVSVAAHVEVYIFRYYAQDLFALHVSLLVFDFLLTCNHKQVFSGCKLAG